MEDPLKTRLTLTNTFEVAKRAGIAYYDSYNGTSRPRYILDLEISWDSSGSAYRAMLTFTLDKVNDGWILTLKPTIRNDLSVVIKEDNELRLIEFMETQVGLFLRHMVVQGLVKRADSMHCIRWEVNKVVGLRKFAIRDIFARTTMARTSAPGEIGRTGQKTIKDGMVLA